MREYWWRSSRVQGCPVVSRLALGRKGNSLVPRAVFGTEKACCPISANGGPVKTAVLAGSGRQLPICWGNPYTPMGALAPAEPMMKHVQSLAQQRHTTASKMAPQAALFYDLMCTVLLGLVQESLRTLCCVHVDIRTCSVCVHRPVCARVCE